MMKIFKGATLLILISLTLVFFISITLIIYGICNRNMTLFQNKYYDTVEELHYEYLLEFEKSYNNGDSMTDYYPEKLVNYFEDNDVVYVICTYSSLIDKNVETDSLMVYILNKNHNGYYLEIPYYGISAIYSAIIPLHDNYENLDYKKNYTEYKNKDFEVCYGFAYKNNKESYNLLFDDSIMKEIECINPFTNEEFILCYGTSQKVYNLIGMILTPLEERHILTIQ